MTYMNQNGHSNLTVQECGLFVSLSNSWLAGTPDGLVHDPDNDSAQPLGLVEIKNPYSVRELILTEAIKTSTFCLEQNKDTYRLKGDMSANFIVPIETGVTLFCTLTRICT